MGISVWFNLAIMFFIFQGNRLEERLRSELLAGRQAADVDSLILLLRSKCDLKSFRQYLKVKMIFVLKSIP